MKPSIPALRGPGGVSVVAPAEKASLLSSQFYSQQCQEQFDTHLSCFPQSRCNSLAFRTPFLLRLLIDIDRYGSVDPLGVFPLFLNMVADIIAPKLSISFCGLIRIGSFPDCWRSVNATDIPKGAQSPDRENYRPLSITPILSKVYKKFISHKLSSLCEKHVFFPQFAYMKGLGYSDALLTISHHLQKSLDTGMESFSLSRLQCSHR